jgi:hypothetical protein
MYTKHRYVCFFQFRNRVFVLRTGLSLTKVRSGFDKDDDDDSDSDSDNGSGSSGIFSIDLSDGESNSIVGYRCNQV